MEEFGKRAIPHVNFLLNAEKRCSHDEREKRICL